MIRFLLTALILFNVTFGHGQTKSFIDQPFIEVTGQADTLVTPNEIYIRIIVSERDNRDKISIEELEGRMISAFKNMEINTENDLTTSDMLSNYRFYLLKQRDIMKSKEYTLKVTDAAMASKVFIKLEDLGISNSSIENVDHTDYKLIENLCRTKAILAAKGKAISMTQPINQSIGRAIYISDIPQDYDQQLQGRAPGIMIRGYSAIHSGKYEPPKIEFKKIKISTTVSVKFILE